MSTNLPMENVNLSQVQPGAGVQNESDQEAKRLEQEQMRRDLVASILDSAARERLSRIALVSPERSSKIEGLILSLAQAGKIQRGQRVSENQLIDLLEQLEERGNSTNKKATIVFQRRKDIDDDLDF